MPCGINKIYPKENEGLYKDILNNNGLVISEYELNVEANSNKFLERNRIVSGISLGVLVIESAYRSGTSVTARIAKKQGRKVFALPYNIKHVQGVGNNKLIKNGIAEMVTSAEEIIKKIPNLEYKKMINKKFEIRSREKIKNKRKCLNQEYNKVYKFINNEACGIEEICKKSKKSISEVNNILLMLEIEGYIEKSAGGYRCIENSY